MSTPGPAGRSPSMTTPKGAWGRSRPSSLRSRPAPRWTSISIALKKRQPVVTYRIHARGRSATSTRRSSRGSTSSTRSSDPASRRRRSPAASSCRRRSTARSARCSPPAPPRSTTLPRVPPGRADRRGRGPGDGAVSAARYRRLGGRPAVPGACAASSSGARPAAPRPGGACSLMLDFGRSGRVHFPDANGRHQL